MAIRGGHCPACKWPCSSDSLSVKGPLELTAAQQARSTAHL